MQSAAIGVSGVLIVLLALGAGIIVLQIYLSKKESLWPGLILPMISLALALMATLGMLFFRIHVATTTTIENGEVVAQTVNTLSEPVSIIVSAAVAFLFYSIPTVILTLIYLACRGKRRKQRALEKMSVQDL